jgi:hypothetical protein
VPARRGPAAARQLRAAKPIRKLRTLTRYRKTQIQERAREANRLHKALEDAGTGGVDRSAREARELRAGIVVDGALRPRGEHRAGGGDVTLVCVMHGR